jgi:hypothetical protein
LLQALGSKARRSEAKPNKTEGEAKAYHLYQHYQLFNLPLRSKSKA